MSSDLYETLDITANATAEEVRKAYKRKALQTHPDRQPNSTPLQKAAAEEQFRKVNNAYEVLNDPQKRRVYDLHGIWPPPEHDAADMPYSASATRSRGSRTPSTRQRTYHEAFTSPIPDPFMQAHAHHHYHNHSEPFGAAFSDPFSIFDSVFGTGSTPRHHHDPFNLEDLVGGIPGIQIDGRGNVQINLGAAFSASAGASARPRSFEFEASAGRRTQEPARMQRSHTGGSGIQWVSETTTTQTVNGVTQSIRKRRDVDGNEYVTRTYADGRKVRTVNGVEQSSSAQRHIPVAQHPPLPDRSHQQYGNNARYSQSTPVASYSLPSRQNTLHTAQPTRAQHMPETEYDRPEEPKYSAHKVRNRTRSTVSSREYDADLSENEPRWSVKQWLKRKHQPQHSRRAIGGLV